MRFLLANTTWNSKGWTDASRDHSGFQWVAEDPRRHTPGESWNFAPPKGEWKYGFFENLGRKIHHFEDGGVVFFISTNHGDGLRYITGFYAHATVFSPRQRPNGHWVCMKARWTYCLKLPSYLPFHPSRHLPAGKHGVRYFTYLNPAQAKHILSDMLAIAKKEPFPGHTSGRLSKIALNYFPDIKPSAIQLKTTHNTTGPVANSTLKHFVAKDLTDYVGPAFVKISKNNAQLQSYRDHEALKQQLAAHLESQGYNVRWDKHLDLVAQRKGKRLIVEVKSCRADNLERQIRLGAAQINFYRFLYRKQLKDAGGLLALQTRPSDSLIEFVVGHCGYDLLFPSGNALNHLYAEANG